MCVCVFFLLMCVYGTVCGRSGPDANHPWDLHLKQLLINKQFHLNWGEDTNIHGFTATAFLTAPDRAFTVHILYKYAVTPKPI